MNTSTYVSFNLYFIISIILINYFYFISDEYLHDFQNKIVIVN